MQYEVFRKDKKNWIFDIKKTQQIGKNKNLC